MRKTKFIIALLSLATALVFIGSCKKDASINPYDDPSLKKPETGTTEASLDPNSFEYLYKKVFKPTCANSSCHDGSFEPDFRTMYGAYNTLVYHPVISNDNGLTYKYRVLPYDINKSLIVRRLIQMPYNEIGQGRMPWIDSTWYYQSQNQSYIQNVKNWINNGAKDMFGNKPSPGNREPTVAGLQFFPAGTTTSPYPRGGTYANDPLEVPTSTNTDIWISIDDDSTSAQNMVITDIKISTKCYDFTNAVGGSMAYTTPITSTDFWNTSVQFTHKYASFSTSAYPANTILFIRVYLKDTSHSTPAEVPNDGSSSSQIKFFTVKII